jgi:hypothetical protein
MQVTCARPGDDFEETFGAEDTPGYADVAELVDDD